MAYRATSLRSMVNWMGGNRMIATSTVPKMKPFAGGAAVGVPTKHTSTYKADYFPIYMVCGMVLMAMSFGGHTAKQQLQYSPNVRISKKRREEFPEVVHPDYVVEEADKFVNKSFFRKLAHIQESDMAHTIRDPSKGSVFTHGRNVETLKSVGVNPESL